MSFPRRVSFLRSVAVIGFITLTAEGSAAQGTQAPTHGHASPRLAIRNAMIVDGNGTPAHGPADILVENGRIAEIVFWIR